MQSWYRKIPLRLKRHWIKGHQDEKIPFRRLDRMAQLNVLCDESAKVLGRQQPAQIVPSEVYSDLWRLTIGGKTVVHKVDEQLREWIHDPKLKQYWKGINKISDASETLIDWEAIKVAAKGTKKRKTIVMTKLLSDNAPTNDNMVKWGFRQCQKCPRCGQENETADHINACTDQAAVKVWDESLRTLNEWMRKQQTDPMIRRFLINLLRNWKRGEPLPQATGRLSEIIADQETIGWDRFMFGFISKRWATAQQETYDRQGSRRDGRRWAASIIQKIWDISRDQWIHRNSVLHSGDRLAEFHDPDTLEEDVRVAFGAGTPQPCPAKYRRWFRFTHVDQILSKPALDQRLWLRSVALIRTQVTTLQNETQHMRQRMEAWLRGANPHI